ncbi:MAG TPA: Mov34/MPN/PAD-1 family protein [Thermoanaerobaculia bacterium]|nr:Mov34/MPN/PAD-1 family protein [Thermoanaerobaculia bacterium]
MNAAIALLLSLQMSISGASCGLVQREMLPILADLFKVSRTPSKETERALFVTRDDDGKLQSQLWPATYERRKASFHGAVPANTVGIAHTHPNGMPEPSRHDIDEAQRTGLPIFVVTRTSIARVDPDRTTRHLVTKKDWYGAWRRTGDACAALS